MKAEKQELRISIAWRFNETLNRRASPSSGLGLYIVYTLKILYLYFVTFKMQFELFVGPS